MEESCVDATADLLSVPKHVLQELGLDPEDDGLADFCDIKRKASVTSRRKSRRSMNFTPEKVMLLTSSETPTKCCSSSGVDKCRETDAQASSDFSGASFSTKELSQTLIDEENPLIGEENLAPDLMEEPAKRKKYKRRRRSADFEVIQNTQSTLSPDLEMEGLEEVQKLPGSRKSRRIKRQSIELCRPVLLPLPCDSPGSESPPVSLTSSPALECADRVELSGLQGPDPSLVEARLSQSIDNTTCSQAMDSSQSTDTTPDNQPHTQTTSSTKTVKKTRAPAKRGRKKKDAEEPPLEDIYKNKLWRSQMPKEGTWETIFESPRMGKGGELEMVSSKRFRRILSYDDFFTKQKLKRRWQKAKALGFKPMTARRRAVAEASLEAKLLDLDTCLACQETDMETSEHSLPSTTSSQEYNNNTLTSQQTHTQTLTDVLDSISIVKENLTELNLSSV